MLVDIRKSIFFFPITLGCLTSGILTTKVLRNFQPGTSLQPPPLSYLPTTNTVLPKLSQHAVFVNQALDNGLEDAAGPSRGFAERQTQGHSYLKPLSIDLRAPFKDQEIKLITDKHRSPKEIQGGHETATSKKILNTSGVTIARVRSEVEHHPQAPRRTSYQVVEERDEYRTDNSDHARLPYPEKVLTSNPHRNSQDITAAIKALDHFLTGVLNGDSYNSGLHPPPSPVLALVLSRYGRYVLGARNPRLYAHMAVNNIHNNKPFGSYKVESEQEPTYNRR
ncbi:uncharacterized protein LOC143216946 [Lasioglossum baleicum]|uniref:uncharacterized protein LOC143216946 n=1 Tax=Lasioglossum baleicum TaxID=434251 RepID=UPI003FCDE5C9